MLETQDLKDFSITSWYSKFKDVALRTIILLIHPDLLVKFRADLNDEEIMEHCNAEFQQVLRNSIKELSNKVFVKNNWHAPTDAKFMALGNEIKVSNIKDLFTYFSVSEIISQDFEQTKFDNFCIALRPYINIHPASEFRCIVINNILRGITPRDWPTFYGHFSEEGPEIINALSNFYQRHIKNNFPRENYTFDVVQTGNEIVLLDFGPLNSKSNLYAFTWKEIQSIIAKNSIEEVPPVFRFLESDMGIMTRSEALFKISKSHS